MNARANPFTPLLVVLLLFLPTAAAGITRASSDSSQCTRNLCSVEVSHELYFDPGLDAYSCFGTPGDYYGCYFSQICELHAEGIQVVGALSCGNVSTTCSGLTECDAFLVEHVYVPVYQCRDLTATGWVVTPLGSAQATPSPVHGCVGPSGRF